MYLIPKLEAQFRLGLLREDLLTPETERLKECLEQSRYFDFEDDASTMVLSMGLRPLRDWLWLPAPGEHWPILMVEMKLPVDDDAKEWRRVVISTWTGHLILSFEAPGDKTRLWHFPIGSVLDEGALHGEYVLDGGEKVDPYALLKDQADRDKMTSALKTLNTMLLEVAWGLRDEHGKRWGRNAIDGEADDEFDLTKPPFLVKFTDASALHGALVDPTRLSALPVLIPRFALCALSLILADRETITRHPQPRRTTLKGATKNGPRLYVPEHYTVTHTLLKKIVTEKVETGVQRKEREKIRKKRHKVEEHTRTLRSGRVVKVHAHERGDENLGWAPRRIRRVTPPPGDGT